MKKLLSLLLTVIFLVLSYFVVIKIGWSNPYHINRYCGKRLKWDSNTKRMYAGSVSFPSTGTRWPALEDAIRIINQNPSRFSFTLSHDTNGVRRNNGVNEIWFSRDQDALNGAPAITWTYVGCSGLDEADVVFDADVDWTFYNNIDRINSYGGTRRPFRNTAIHELGHAMGFAHTATEYNIMGRDWTHIYANGDEAITYFGEDASDGAVALYGEQTEPFEDLGVVHWRWTGNSGEYSVHSRTRIFDAGGVLLPMVPGTSQPQYLVDNGQTIRVEFSFENNGLTTQEVWIAYYLSNNEWISWDDHNLHQSRTYTLGRNHVYTTIESITLPDDLAPNTDYRIGVAVDSRSEVSEVWEGNNFSYIDIRTTNFPTPTPTPTNTPRPTFTPTPTFFPQIVTPTPTPTPGEPIDFVITPDWLHFVQKEYEQLTYPIPGTISIHGNPNSGIQNIESTFRLEGGDYGNSPCVVLQQGIILTACTQTNDKQQYLAFINQVGSIIPFAKLQPLSVQIKDIQFTIDNIHVMSLDYDGKDTIVALCSANGYYKPYKMSVNFNFRTTIKGVAIETLIDSALLY